MQNNFMKFVGCVCAAAIPIAMLITGNDAEFISILALGAIIAIATR